MGTATALDAPLGATAGAVVSGAYFGDKLSPLSDSTNICAIGAGTPLYTHIRHMLYTALPSFGVALVVYALAATLVPVAADGLPDRAVTLLEEIEGAYSLGWTVLLPPAVVVASIVGRIPAALAMATSSMVALAIAVAGQGIAFADGVSAAVVGFRAGMLSGLAWSEPFTTLVERGGLHAMSNTLIVIIAAFLLAGAMDVSGSLDLMIQRMLAAVRSVFGLVVATMAAGSAMIALTSHGGVTSARGRRAVPEGLSRPGHGPGEPVAVARGLGHHRRAADAVDRLRGLHGDHARRRHDHLRSVGGVLAAAGRLLRAHRLRADARARRLSFPQRGSGLRGPIAKQ